MSKFMADMVRRMAKEDYGQRRDSAINGVTLEDRRAIVRAIGALGGPKCSKRAADVSTYVRKECNKQSLTHFFETANAGQIGHLKALLDLA